MSGVDEPAKVIRRAVATRGRKDGDAVVPPVARPRKVGDRHQFYRGHAKIDEIRQPLHHTRKCTLGREGPDVQLVDDQVTQADAGPLLTRPAKRVGIDDDRRAMDAVGLTARGGIRERTFTIEPVPNRSPGRTSSNTPVKLPSGRRASEWMDGESPSRSTITSTCSYAGAQTLNLVAAPSRHAPSVGSHGAPVGVARTRARGSMARSLFQIGRYPARLASRSPENDGATIA